LSEDTLLDAVVSDDEFYLFNRTGVERSFMVQALLPAFQINAQA